MGFTGCSSSSTGFYRVSAGLDGLDSIVIEFDRL